MTQHTIVWKNVFSGGITSWEFIGRLIASVRPASLVANGFQIFEATMEQMRGRETQNLQGGC